jgi:methylenetetrahydrofolate dehydrogenase (NADP+) / methenyltetrahydrofolate cyclohydrolase
MTARLLDGNATAAAIRQEIAGQVFRWRESGGPIPRLAAILVGEDPASQVYVRNKERACQSVGMESCVIRLPSETSIRQLTDPGPVAPS